MINFDKETIIPVVIEAVDAGASADEIIALIERQATEQGIDLVASPAFNDYIDSEIEYRAFTNWTQALYEGFKHHHKAMFECGLADATFLEYAKSAHAVFGVSVFLLEYESANAGKDLGPDATLEDLGNIEAYDLRTAQDNRQCDWIDWVRGPESLVCGVETWLETFCGFDKETF